MALGIKNPEATAKTIRTEREVLKARQEQAERKAALVLREWLSMALDSGKMETVRVKISFRKSVVVEVDDRLPKKKWCSKKIVYTPDKIVTP